MSSKVSAAILTRGWRCLDCTVCENCGRNVDESKLLLCDVCDTSYHIYCLTPALDRVPPGGWRCSACVVCATCGTRESRDWEKNYTECGACASRVTCPVCRVDYAENELVLRCDSCRRWLHAACDGYESERDVDAASANGYRCASCRPRAKHVNRPAPALGLAEQLRESAFGLYAILRDRRADRGAATSCRELETLLKTKAKRTKNDEDDLQRVLTYVSHVTTSNGSDVKSPNIHAIARILSKLWRSNLRSRSVSPTSRQSPVARFRRHSIGSCSDVRPPTTVAWAELVPSSENRRQRHGDLSTTCATGLRNLYEKALSKDSGVSSSDGRVFRWASTALEKLEKSVIKLPPPPPPPPKPPVTTTPAAKRKKKSKTSSTTPTTTKINNSNISTNNVPVPLYDKNWETDEARGDGAHQAPVLFANMTHPNLKKDYPGSLLYTDVKKSVFSLSRAERGRPLVFFLSLSFLYRMVDSRASDYESLAGERSERARSLRQHGEKKSFVENVDKSRLHGNDGDGNSGYDDDDFFVDYFDSGSVVAGAGGGGGVSSLSSSPSSV